MSVRFDGVTRRLHLAAILASCVRGGLRHEDRLPRPEDLSGLQARARSAGGAVELVGELAAAYTAPVDTAARGAADAVLGGRRVRREPFGYVSVPHEYRDVRFDTRIIRALLEGTPLTGASMRTVRRLFDQLQDDVDHNATRLDVDDVRLLDAALEAAGSTLEIAATSAPGGALRVRVCHRTRMAHDLQESCRRLLQVGVVHGRLGAAIGDSADPAAVTHWETAARISPAAQRLALELVHSSCPERSDVLELADAAGIPAPTFARALPLLVELLGPLRDRWSGERPSSLDGDVALRTVPDPLGAVFALSDLLAVREHV